MRKAGFVLVFLALLCPAALPSRAADHLYDKLYGLARANLANLPKPAKTEYTRLLRQYPDRLMAFLLAYEESGRLLEADPACVEGHYESLAELMEEQGITQPDEFFLSYVAKITVSDEPITGYRQVFETEEDDYGSFIWPSLGLRRLRQEIRDPVELYRKVCLLATELLVYKPTSGRDQSPLDIAWGSLHGRCEESQILFAALCRTAGIPARAASTPWWAHQDDNHAWVEVFLDGRWHYSGDSDGGYWPDQTWFSGLAGKMVIITADGSLPAPDDEVLARDAHGALINSIRYYAGENTRTLKIKAVNKKGEPASNCNLAIEVYNYYSLRPQAFLSADHKGEQTVTVGTGAFFLLAWQDSLAALQFVPSNNLKELNYTLKLESSRLPERSVLMEYPNRKTDFRDAPQSWKDEVRAAKQSWQSKLDRYRGITSPEVFQTFIRNDSLSYWELLEPCWGKDFEDGDLEADQLEILVSGLPEELLADSLFFQICRKANLNLISWLEACHLIAGSEWFERIGRMPALFREWLTVLDKNDEKDLWQADAYLLYRMFDWFRQTYPGVKDLPEAELLNLFEPTVFYENLPWLSRLAELCGSDAPGRAEAPPLTSLYPDRMRPVKPAEPSVRQVISHFRKKHKINVKKAVPGLLPLELALERKHLTGYQYKILACYYLRASRIPANYTRIPNVISVYADGAWQYYDLSANDFYRFEKGKAETFRSVAFEFKDELGQPAALRPDQVNICFLKDGQFFPAGEQPNYLGSGRFEAKVPQAGTFYAQIGYRNSDSLTVYFLRPLSWAGGPVSKVSLRLDYYNQAWQAAEDFLKPVLAELDSLGYVYAVLGSFTRENSIRMAGKLEEAGKRFLFAGFEDGMVERFEYRPLASLKQLVKETPSLQGRTLTLAKHPETGAWQMYEGIWDRLP